MDWSYQEHRQAAPQSICCAVLTISDTRRKPADDQSGQLLKTLLKQNAHHTQSYAIVADDAQDIRHQLKDMLREPKVQAVLINGGTGIAERDVTIQVVSSLITKSLPGFGEIFRMLSYQQVGAAAMLSRAIAGAVDEKLLFALPGSSAAVRLAMEKLILPELAHAVYELGK